MPVVQGHQHTKAAYFEEARVELLRSYRGWRAAALGSHAASDMTVYPHGLSLYVKGFVSTKQPNGMRPKPSEVFFPLNFSISFLADDSLQIYSFSLNLNFLTYNVKSVIEVTGHDL